MAVRTFFFDAAGGVEQFLGEFDQAKYDEVAPELWEKPERRRADALAPGEDLPAGQPEVEKLFAGDEVDAYLTYGTSAVPGLVEKGTLPETTRTAVFDKGNIGNYSFTAIPKNAQDKAAAKVLANLLLSPEAALENAGPDGAGFTSAIDLAKLRRGTARGVRAAAVLALPRARRRARRGHAARGRERVRHRAREGLEGERPAEVTPLTAAPRRRRGLPQGLRTLLLLAPALVVVLVLFGGGVVLGVLGSLGYQPFLPTSDLSLDAYRGLLDDVEVRRSLGLTFRIALVSTVVSAVLAVAAALLLRGTRRGRRAALLVFQLNLPVPHLVGAAAMLLLLGQSGLVSRLLFAAGLVDSPGDAPVLTNDVVGWAIMAEYVWKEVPFIGVVVLAALSCGVSDLEDAARTLGAGAWARLRHVVLPHVAPAVLSTSIIVFAFTFGSYEVPLLLGQPFPATLPVVAYQAYADTDLTSRPRAMAIAVLITFLVVLVVVAYSVLTERVLRPAERRRVTGTA